MKKIIATLLIALVALTAFAANNTSDTLQVKLGVEAHTDVAFTSDPVSVYTTTVQTGLTEKSLALDSDYYKATVYASLITNQTISTITLNWANLSASGIEPSLPLTIVSSACSVNGSVQEYTSQTATSSSKSASDLISLTVPEAIGARAICYTLDLSVAKTDYDAAPAASYATDLKITVSAS